MTVTELVAGVYLKATGKTTTLTSGSSKYNRILGLANFYSRRWANERGVDWSSLYDPALSIGTVSATDSFDLDTDTVRKLSDREGDTVRIVWTDGVGYTDYDIVPANQLKDYYLGASKESPNGYYCAKVGASLVFNVTFSSSSPEYGGEIFVPCYTYPDTLAGASDEIQVDDPDWLVLACAAEYVRNDITRQQNYPLILSEANEAMQRMKDNEAAQVDLVNRPWTPPSGVGTDNAWS